MNEFRAKVRGVDRGHIDDVERRLRSRSLEVSHVIRDGSVHFVVRGSLGPRELQAELRRVLHHSLGRDPPMTVER